MDRGGGCLPTHVHMHAHVRMHTHAHACVVNMIISCKWPPPLGESMGIPYDVICMCAHACMCMCVHMCGGHPLTNPHPIYPPPPPSTHPAPPRGDPGISQNSVTLELIEIFQFCLKI